MSRVFEALHRSLSERPGAAANKSFSTATEMLESAERNTQETHQVAFNSVPTAIDPDKRLVTLTATDSLGAETFRLLAVRMRYLQQTHALKTLLVTSTMAEEGKSCVAANLAVTLARKQRQKVLLIDGDLRRPTLAKLFGLRHLTGLSEWLTDNHDDPPPIYQLDGAALWLLPAGLTPDNPLELLQSRTLSHLIDQLSSTFEWIVIDSPPVLPLADTTVWLSVINGTLLVAREGKTQKRQLQKGLEALNKSKLLGVVLNECTTADHTNYYQRYHPHPATAR